LEKIKSLKYFNPTFQVEVDWMLTQRCNYSCSYCSSYDNNQPFNFKTLEEYVSAFRYLSDRYGNKTIKLNFLGGEPTLFKQWVELINWLSSYNYVPHITTNLSIPVSSYVSKLNGKCLNFIIASFHSEHADLNMFYENAKILNDYGYLDKITIPADPNNWDYTLKCYEKLSEITWTSLVRIKNEFTDDISIAGSYLDYTKEQLKVFENTVRDDPYMEVDTGSDIVNPSIATIRLKYSNFKGMNCAVGRDRMHIVPSGDAYPSSCLLNYPKALMGNIFMKNIKVPKKAIKCPFNQCWCGPDIRIEKWA